MAAKLWWFKVESVESSFIFSGQKPINLDMCSPEGRVYMFIKTIDSYFIVFPTLDAFFSATTDTIDLIFAPLESGGSPLPIEATYNVHKFVLACGKQEKWMY